MQKRPRVLLVEDNDAASRGLSKLLAALGYEVQVVFDGTSALEALRTSPPPDFVLTDLRLPDLDGREVALAARQLSPPPRIALITGWDLDRDHHNRARWGIDWVFTKPLNVQELVSKLQEGPGSAPPDTPDGSPRPPGGEGGEGTS
jgi:CheY-like chemotaxis protein